MVHYHFKKKTLRIIEFLIIGVLFGLIEDIIKIKVLVYKNRPASEIRLSIDRFKSEWKRVME